MLLMKTHTGYALQMQQTSRDVELGGDSDGELDAEMSALSLHRDGSADEQSSDLTLPPPAVYHYHSRDTLDDPSTLARAGITREQAQELTVEVGDVEGDDGRDLEMECAMTFTRPSTGFEDEPAPGFAAAAAAASADTASADTASADTSSPSLLQQLSDLSNGFLGAEHTEPPGRELTFRSDHVFVVAEYESRNKNWSSYWLPNATSMRFLSDGRILCGVSGGGHQASYSVQRSRCGRGRGSLGLHWDWYGIENLQTQDGGNTFTGTRPGRDRKVYFTLVRRTGANLLDLADMQLGGVEGQSATAPPQLGASACATARRMGLNGHLDPPMHAYGEGTPFDEPVVVLLHEILDLAEISCTYLAEISATEGESVPGPAQLRLWQQFCREVIACAPTELATTDPALFEAEEESELLSAWEACRVQIASIRGALLTAGAIAPESFRELPSSIIQFQEFGFALVPTSEWQRDQDTWEQGPLRFLIEHKQQMLLGPSSLMSVLSMSACSPCLQHTVQKLEWWQQRHSMSTQDAVHCLTCNREWPSARQARECPLVPPHMVMAGRLPGTECKAARKRKRKQRACTRRQSSPSSFSTL
jgi:hypothetical protein